MRPRYEKIIKKNSLEFEEYDFDEDSEIFKEHNIGKILPVFILYKDNQEVLRIIGEKSKKELKKLLGGILNV